MTGGSGIKSVRDLVVYQRLVQLHLEVDALTMMFPAHERYELGAQLRRASNSAPANLAETWNNKHTKIYLEGIQRAIGEVQEVEHHIELVFRKRYVDASRYNELLARYQESRRMLWGLARSLRRSLRPATGSGAPLSPVTYHLSPESSV